MAYILKDANGEPIKRQDQEIYAYDKSGSIKAVNKENRTLVIIGTDESKDRDGDIISMKGWNMENFLKNPVFLYAHNYSSVPIGSATKVIKRKNPDRLEFHEKFPTEGLYPFADMIFELFNEKILNASSVGFIPMEWEPLEKDSENSMMGRGRKYLKQELLELSACPVPSNPNALQNSIKFMKSHSADEIALMMSGQMDLDIKKDEVLGELEVKEIEFVDEEKIQSFVPPNFETQEEASAEEFVTVKGELEEVKEEKVGAVLNKKNMKRLQDALDLIKQVVEEAIKEENTVEDDEEKDITLADVMDQIDIIASDIDEIKDQLNESTQSKDDGVNNTEEKEEEDTSLQKEYEKLLSQSDNEKHEDETDNSSDEDDEILKQVITQLKETILKKE